MPVVEKTDGSRVYIRPLDQRFDIGDRAEVSAEQAQYLVTERGDFEVVDDVDGGEADGEDESTDLDTAREKVTVDPSQHTIDELKSRLQDVDQFAEIDAIRALEEHDEERSGALEAIDDRRSELEA